MILIFWDPAVHVAGIKIVLVDAHRHDLSSDGLARSLVRSPEWFYITSHHNRAC